MTYIRFVRHGQTDWNITGTIQGQTDIPLNNFGIKQAKYCALSLSVKDFDIIITSPLKRAKMTATIINKQLNIPIYYHDAFKERYFGYGEGKTKAKLDFDYPDRNYPNQESRLTVNRRVMSALNTIIKTHKDKRILIVSHGAVLNSILSSVSNHLIGSKITTLKNGSFTDLIVKDDIWLIENHNLVNHLN